MRRGTEAPPNDPEEKTPQPRAEMKSSRAGIRWQRNARPKSGLLHSFLESIDCLILSVSDIGRDTLGAGVAALSREKANFLGCFEWLNASLRKPTDHGADDR